MSKLAPTNHVLRVAVPRRRRTLQRVSGLSRSDAERLASHINALEARGRALEAQNEHLRDRLALPPPDPKLTAAQRLLRRHEVLAEAQRRHITSLGQRLAASEAALDATRRRCVRLQRRCNEPGVLRFLQQLAEMHAACGDLPALVQSDSSGESSTLPARRRRG